MKILVKVKTRAKQEKVERLNQPSLGLHPNEDNKPIYRVCVKEAPVDGKANLAVARALASYFDIPVSRVHLKSGQTSPQKIFEIEQ